eukprot:132945_1
MASGLHEPSAQRTWPGRHPTTEGQAARDSLQLPSQHLTGALRGHVDIVGHNEELATKEPSGHLNWISGLTGILSCGQLSRPSRQDKSESHMTWFGGQALAVEQSSLLSAHEPSGHLNCVIGQAWAGKHGFVPCTPNVTVQCPFGYFIWQDGQSDGETQSAARSRHTPVRQRPVFGAFHLSSPVHC